MGELQILRGIQFYKNLDVVGLGHFACERELGFGTADRFVTALEVVLINSGYVELHVALKDGNFITIVNPTLILGERID